MEEKEKILFTILGIVAIIAVVGVIGIFNKPTYLVIPLENFETKKPIETRSNAVTGMVTYELTKDSCQDYYNRYHTTSWFNTWKFYKENCEAEYGDLSKPTSCEVKYLDEYKCGELNYLQRKWQENNCKTGWKYVQYCKYGCSDGKCNPALSSSAQGQISSKPSQRVRTCTAGWLYDYRCYKGNVQRLYQNTDCAEEYKDFYICKNGCDSKTKECVIEEEPSYKEGWLDEYVCVGKYLKQKYQYSSGATQDFSKVYCSKGCSNNECIE